MNALSKRFDAEGKSYRKLLKSTEARVVRWDYWSGFQWHWDPAELKSQQHDADPRFPSQRTTKEKAHYAYGHDAERRLVLIRHGVSLKSESRVSEEFIHYAGNTLSSSRFFAGHLLEVANATVENGKVVYVEEIGSGSDWHTVEWNGQQVVRILFGMFGKKAGLEWSYDSSGKLLGMFDLPRKVRLPKGVSFATFKKTIYQRLMEAIPKVVAKANINSSAYCLALAYDGEGNGVLPPTLGIGLESERLGWLKKDPRNARLRIWNPAEFRHYETNRTSLPPNRKLARSCQLFNDLLDRKGDDKPARALLNKVARDLGKLDWTGKLRTTGDFVVFAVDLEGGDLLKNLKESASVEVLRSLKKAKML